MHVDDFIDSPSSDPYASFVLQLFRFPAMSGAKWWPWIKEHKLFCYFELRRYRCIGASRMGDVWLTDKFDRDTGYDLRVDVEQCSDWADEP